MSLGKEIQVTLASNVKSNVRNKPADFETTLAKTLDLLGEWEVALIDLSYPHNWMNLDKPINVAVLTDPTNNIDDMVLDTSPYPVVQELYRTLTSPGGLTNMWVRRIFKLDPGNYTV